MALLWNGAVSSLTPCLASFPSPRIAKTLCCIPFASLLLLEAWRLQTQRVYFRKLQAAREATLWVKACWRECVPFWGVCRDCFASSFPAALYQTWLQRAQLNQIHGSFWIWVSCRSCRVVEQREYLTEGEETSQGLSSFLCLWRFCPTCQQKRRSQLLVVQEGIRVESDSAVPCLLL